MGGEDRYHWPVARPFSPHAELARVYWTAACRPALWRELGRYLVAIIVYFTVAVGGGWLWAVCKGGPWLLLPAAPETANWAFPAFDAVLFLGGLTHFNPFVPLYPICLSDTFHYLLKPHSVKPVLIGRWMLAFPLFLLLAMWWYHHRGVIVGWADSLVALAAMGGALLLYRVQIGKTCRDLQLPGVLTWHLLAWLGTSAYAVDGLRGILLGLLPVGVVLALLVLIVALRGAGPVIVIASLEVHGREEDTLRLPAVNVTLLLSLLVLALLLGTGLGVGLDRLGAIEFSPFAFGLTGRLVLVLPATLLVLKPFLSTRSDAQSIADQLLDRHLMVRDKRGTRPNTLLPGAATAEFLFDRLKWSAAFTCVLVVSLAGGVMTAFGLAAAVGQERRLFPLGDIGLITVVVVTVSGIAAFRDLVGTYYESSKVTGGTGYVAPGVSTFTPRVGGLNALFKSWGRQNSNG